MTEFSFSFGTRTPLTIDFERYTPSFNKIILTQNLAEDHDKFNIAEK